jgi:hypothetical protein
MLLASGAAVARYLAGMNLPLGSRVIIDRTNEPNHAPGELALLVKSLGLEIQASTTPRAAITFCTARWSRGRNHYYTFAVRRVPSVNGVRAMAASLARRGAP